MKRTHLALLASLALAATPVLTGCWNGQAATTTVQASMNSGNGVAAHAGPLNIENATLVLGPEGSLSGTLTTRIVNTGIETDTLVYARVNGVDAYLTGDDVEIPPGASISFGFDAQHWINTYTLDVPISSYVPVELGFTEAGLVKISVLTVPPAGYYAGIAPEPPAAPTG